MFATGVGIDSEVTETAESLALFSVIRPAPEILCCELRGEAVVLSLKTGVYHGLDAVGARIWQLIQQPRPVDEVCELLVFEYAVERGRCEREVIAFLSNLAALGLISIDE
jgi:hypothetical protein